jgi:hypothetical protein
MQRQVKAHKKKIRSFLKILNIGQDCSNKIFSLKKKKEEEEEKEEKEEGTRRRGRRRGVQRVFHCAMNQIFKLDGVRTNAI